MVKVKTLKARSFMKAIRKVENFREKVGDQQIWEIEWKPKGKGWTIEVMYSKIK